MDNYERILKEIAGLDIKFKVIKPIKNSMNGVETESVLLEYEKEQFVYVPGMSEVLLGWDAQKCSMGEKILHAMKKYHEEEYDHFLDELEDCEQDYLSDIEDANKKGDLEKVQQLQSDMQEDLDAIKEQMKETFEDFRKEWDNYLKECMSPLRKTDIKSMIVEVNSRYLEKDITYKEFRKELDKTPFTIPTEDEWEYLCNGGTRTLLRWGDSLEQELEGMFQVGTVNNEDSEILTKPNMFGLFISYNSYKNELIDNLQYTKGGDGGSSLCGGDGLIYVLPAYTAFYRANLTDHVLSKNFYSYRRIVRLE